jgi:hypothetical protein
MLAVRNRIRAHARECGVCCVGSQPAQFYAGPISWRRDGGAIVVTQPAQSTPQCRALACLLVERQVSLELSAYKLKEAQATLLTFIELVDSDLLPARLRDEFVCALHCQIARYLWRLDMAADAKARLRQVSQLTKLDNTKVGALVYEAIIVVLSEEEPDLDQGNQAGLPSPQLPAEDYSRHMDLEQLLAVIKVSVSRPMGLILSAEASVAHLTSSRMRQHRN